MSGKSGRNNKPTYKPQNTSVKKPLINFSLLDKMEEGKEYASIVGLKNVNIQFHEELKRAIADIESIRKRPLLCYASNVLNPNITASTAIDLADEQPFSEMISNVPNDCKNVDILLVTPGGSAETVSILAERARKRFENITFIVPYMAMSAGTIFCLSGDEIIMTKNAYLGPIDPQVFSNKAGRYFPAQAILTVIKTIQDRGQKQLENGKIPNWSDLEILKNIDVKEIGNSITASQFSKELVANYLKTYKFKDWTQHKNGSTVTDLDREERAKKISDLLCEHEKWNSHARPLSRTTLAEECQLKITHSEHIEGLDRAIRRFWALLSVVFENMGLIKIIASSNYMIFRNQITGANKNE